MSLTAQDVRKIAEGMMAVGALMTVCDARGVSMVIEDGFTSSAAAGMRESQVANLTIRLQDLAEQTPAGMLPLMVERQASGQLSMRIAGVTPKGSGIDALVETLHDQVAIEEMMEFFPSGEKSSYGFGHPGRMNPNQRLATIWADSPGQAIVRFMAMRTAGFADDPVAVMAQDIHTDGEIEMRDLSDWGKEDLDGMLDLCREAVSLAVTRRDMDLDFG